MMRNFQHKREFSGFLHSKPVLGLLGILLLFFAWGVIGFMNKLSETSKNRKIVESKIAELEKKKLELSSDITKLESPEGVEEDIRMKFGLAKEGEGMIVVVEDKNQPESKDDSEGGFFSFFKNWFKWSD